MFKQLIKKIAKKFKENNIKFIIIGGQAVLLYGEPRLTKDIDIIIGMTPENLDKILELTKALSLTPLPKNVKDFVNKTFVLPLIDEKNKIRVDIVFSFSPFEKRALERANHVKIDGVDIPFVSLEDLIVFKIFSGREKDIEDVKMLLKRNKELDEKYLIDSLKFISDPENDFLKKYYDIKKNLL